MKDRYRYIHDQKAWRRIIHGVECRYWLSVCIECRAICDGKPVPRIRCYECSNARQAIINRVTGRAHARVQLAIKAGQLPILDGSIQCTDCADPAQVYDHREYAKPLAVDPVCRSCNALRGPAIDSPFPREKDERRALA